MFSDSLYAIRITYTDQALREEHTVARTRAHGRRSFIASQACTSTLTYFTRKTKGQGHGPWHDHEHDMAHEHAMAHPSPHVQLYGLPWREEA